MLGFNNHSDRSIRFRVKLRVQVKLYWNLSIHLRLIGQSRFKLCPPLGCYLLWSKVFMIKNYMLCVGLGHTSIGDPITATKVIKIIQVFPLTKFCVELYKSRNLGILFQHSVSLFVMVSYWVNSSLENRTIIFFDKSIKICGAQKYKLTEMTISSTEVLICHSVRAINDLTNFLISRSQQIIKLHFLNETWLVGLLSSMQRKKVHRYVNKIYFLHKEIFHKAYLVLTYLDKDQKMLT